MSKYIRRGEGEEEGRERRKGRVSKYIRREEGEEEGRERRGGRVST